MPQYGVVTPALAVPTGSTHPVDGLPPLPIGSQRLSLEQFQQLMFLSTQQPELAWPPDRSIALARNAHLTNTASEMAEALADDFDYFEGDIRLEGSTPVMAHDKGDPRGMSVEEWLAIGGRSGRGLKLDIKEVAAVLPTLKAVKRHGIPDGRLVINITVNSANPLAVVPPKLLKQIRHMFPGAIINLSVDANTYPADLLAKLAKAALIVGQPAMFPLRADLVTAEVVAALRRFGKIAVWNSPDIWSPTNIAEATTRLRGLGVDGTIDLRVAGQAQRLIATFLNTSVKLFGWTVTMQFLSRFTRLRRGF